MSIKDINITTGVPVIDELIDGIRWGDNVVWQVTNTLEYSWLARPFVESAYRSGIKIIYLHFDEYMIPQISDKCKVVNIDPKKEFEPPALAFLSWIQSRISACSAEATKIILLPRSGTLHRY